MTCFSRALKLNAKYLSAWTLMGHEFLEMKNTPAAVRAYRKAVGNEPLPPPCLTLFSLTDQQSFRGKCSGLQSVVWFRANVRDIEDAPLCSLLLSQSYNTEVPYPFPSPPRPTHRFSMGAILISNLPFRPYDARMWCAMAKCYESLPDKHEEAIKCYERAEGNTDR